MCNAVPPTVLTEKTLFSYHTLLKKSYSPFFFLVSIFFPFGFSSPVAAFSDALQLYWLFQTLERI